MTHGFYERHIGGTAEVLMEKAQRGKAMHGFTRNYIRVELPPLVADPSLDNQIVSVKLMGFNQDKTALMAAINK